jgi:M6 family metalloprotease-like protein
VVIQREGTRPPSGFTPSAASAGEEAYSPRPLRDFPHDLRPAGVRPSFSSATELLTRSRAGSQAATGPDTLRLAVMRVDFLRDSAGGATSGDGRYDLRRNATGIPVDPPPHDKRYFEQHAEALRRFYHAQSYGTLEIVPTIFPAEAESAYHLNDMADYGPWEIAQEAAIIEKAETLVGDAIAVVDQSGDVDFSRFDAFVVVHAGADFQGDVNRDSPFDIPSFTLTLGESLSVNAGAARVGRVLVLPETVNQDDRLAALNGVFAHEFGHVLGLPDLYNIFNGVPQVGYWSLMDSGENIAAVVVDPETDDEFTAEGIFPTSLDPWSRLQVFPRAVELLMVGEAWAEALEAVEVNHRVPFVSIDGLEYFLVENRALDLDGNGFPFVFQDSTTGVFLGPVDDPDNPGTDGHLEYDAVLPGGGILIWHIDDKIVIPGLVGSGAINFQTGLRGVALEEADRVSDQGRFDFGRPNDPFFAGNNGWFAPGEVPGSEANDGAYTGITIEVTSVPGRFMGVEIRRPLARDGWPVFVRQDEEVFTEPGHAVLADLGRDGLAEFVFAAQVTAAGQPRPLRGLAAVGPDGSPVDTSGALFAQATNRLLPGLAASDRFVLRPGEAESTVVAAVESGGRTWLWNAQGENLLGAVVVAPAFTPPVLWPRGVDPGWVLVAGRGSIHALEVPGTVVLSDTVAEAAEELPVAGPALLPHSDLSATAAVGYASGVIGFFSLGASAPPAPDPVPLPSPARFILCGMVGEESVFEFVVITQDSGVVIGPAEGVRARWPLPREATLRVSPVLGDVDDDGRSEVILAADEGWVGAVNGDGSFGLGWPRRVVPPVQDLKLADLNGDGSLDVLVLDGMGRFHGWDGRGGTLETFPRPLDPLGLDTLAVVSASVGDFDGDGRLTWVGTTQTGALAAVRLPGARLLAGDWLTPGGRPEGGNYQGQPVLSLADRPRLDGEPLLVYPNPARGSGVEIRFLLAAGETAELDLLDLRGEPLSDARLDPRGGFRVGENAVRWDLNGVAPGLYFCRLERDGAAGRRVDVARIVVMR